MIGDETRTATDDDWARMHRDRLDLTTGKVEQGRVDETPIEMARINESLIGTKARYGYASRFYSDSEPTRGMRFDGILEHDRVGDRFESIELGESHYVQENVFALRRAARSEDDGYVVGFVHDESSHKTACWVIDAQKLSDGPVAKVHLPKRVPYGFHSDWVSRAGTGPR